MTAKHDVLAIGSHEVDLRMHVVRRDGEEISLSPIEVGLLRHLLTRTAQPVPAADLLREVWGYRSGVRTNAVPLAVRRLRLKIEVDASDPQVLKTVPGSGYLLDPAGFSSRPAPQHTTTQALPRAPVDSFVGRQAQLDHLRRHLDSGAQLVTLHGPGGAGKTRLALRFASTRMGQAAFCDFAEARTDHDVASALVEGIGIAAGAADPIERAGAALAGRGRIVAILDNAEQVIEAVRAAADMLRQAAPEAMLVVTSRTVLDLAGEKVIAVGPLEDDDAVALLQQRVAERGVELAGAATLREVARHLASLPLAMELIAPQLCVMSPDQVLERLRRGGPLPSRRHGPERQRTLDSTLDWSWELLSERGRAAVGQLTCFVGGFGLEAAEGVLSAEDPVDVVLELVEHAWLVRWPMEDGAFRFQLPETIRSWILRRAQDDPALTAQLAETRARHARFMADLLDPALFEDGWYELDPHQAALARTELDNLVAAARWAIANDAPELAARCCLSAQTPLQRRPLRHARELLSQVLERAAALPPTLHLPLLRARVTVTLPSGDRAATEADATLLLDLARRHGDCGHEVHALLTLSKLDGAASPNRALADQAVEVAERCPVALARVYALNHQAAALVAGGQGSDAVEVYERALTIAEAGGFERAQALTQHVLAVCHFHLGEIGKAIPRFRRGQQLFAEQSNRWSELIALARLGQALLFEGDHEEARELLTFAEARFVELGDHSNAGPARACLGLLALADGDLQQAEAHTRAAIESMSALDIDDPQYAAQLALILDRAGLDDSADRLLAAAEAAPAPPVTEAFVCAVRASIQRRRSQPDPTLEENARRRVSPVHPSVAWVLSL